VLSVPGRWWCWTATGAEDVQPVVSCFAGSVAALERLDVAAGPGAWLEALAELRPDLDLDPAGAVLSTWDDDPWVRAAYSSAAPPEAAWAPAGPFHVCGEHTAGDRAALMDGALASGLRVAAEIAPALRSGRNPDRTVRIPSEEARP
jgi:monoamine oxidase